jgi:hypothetical protein
MFSYSKRKRTFRRALGKKYRRAASFCCFLVRRFVVLLFRRFVVRCVVVLSFYRWVAPPADEEIYPNPSKLGSKSIKIHPKWV